MALERLGPVWHRMGFNQKYIIRNTLRNKVRMATCIFGIAFCMALVFLAFALRDSIQAYSDALAERQNRYDLMVDPVSYTHLFEIEHAVHHVLQHLGACDRPFLIDVSDDKDGDPLPLRQLHQRHGTVLYLSHAAGRGGQIPVVEGLDGVHN